MRATLLPFQPIPPLACSAGWVRPKKQTWEKNTAKLLTASSEQVLHAPSHLVQPHRGALGEGFGATSLHKDFEGWCLRGWLRRMRHWLAKKGSEKNFIAMCQTSDKAITEYIMIHIIFKTAQHTLDFLTATCTRFVYLAACRWPGLAPCQIHQGPSTLHRDSALCVTLMNFSRSFPKILGFSLL